MSNVQKFENLLRSDEGLQAKLKAATEAYEGDRGDEAAVFAAVVAPLAAEAGLPFTLEEAKDFAEADREVSLDEADGVAGAAGICFLIGGNDGPDSDFCVGGNGYAGTGACAYVGVGLIMY